MRVVHVGAASGLGGAAIASYRLHQGLRASGIDSIMLVGLSSSRNDPHVISLYPGALAKWLGARRRFERLYVRLRTGVTATQWSPGPPPMRLERKLWELQPDVIHLHWLNGGFLSLATLASIIRDQPAVWTLHDMWPLTGGCHYAYACRRFQTGCGQCPQLKSLRARDLSRTCFLRKQAAYTGGKLVLVCPSRWMAAQVATSQLLGSAPHWRIANGLDLNVFRPLDKPTAKRELGLSPKTPCILYGAMCATTDPRKGYDLLEAAMRMVGAKLQTDRARLNVFGGPSSMPPGSPCSRLEVHQLGPIRGDAQLAKVYSAADVFVAPSRADNLPTTVLEAMACGTPAVGFAVGGMSDIVEHGVTGYLATPFEPASLADGILTCLHPGNMCFRQAARVKAEREFDLTKQSLRYAELYASLLATKANKAT